MRRSSGNSPSFRHREAGASEQLSQPSQPLLRILKLSYPGVAGHNELGVSASDDAGKC